MSVLVVCFMKSKCCHCRSVRSWIISSCNSELIKSSRRFQHNFDKIRRKLPSKTQSQYNNNYDFLQFRSAKMKENNPPTVSNSGRVARAPVHENDRSPSRTCCIRRPIKIVGRRGLSPIQASSLAEGAGLTQEAQTGALGRLFAAGVKDVSACVDNLWKWNTRRGHSMF